MAQNAAGFGGAAASPLNSFLGNLGGAQNVSPAIPGGGLGSFLSGIQNGAGATPTPTPAPASYLGAATPPPGPAPAAGATPGSVKAPAGITGGLDALGAQTTTPGATSNLPGATAGQPGSHLQAFGNLNPQFQQQLMQIFSYLKTRGLFGGG